MRSRVCVSLMATHASQACSSSSTCVRSSPGVQGSHKQAPNYADLCEVDVNSCKCIKQHACCHSRVSVCLLALQALPSCYSYLICMQSSSGPQESHTQALRYPFISAGACWCNACKCIKVHVDSFSSDCPLLASGASMVILAHDAASNACLIGKRGVFVKGCLDFYTRLPDTNLERHCICLCIIHTVHCHANC